MKCGFRATPDGKRKLLIVSGFEAGDLIQIDAAPSVEPRAFQCVPFTNALQVEVLPADMESVRLKRLRRLGELPQLAAVTGKKGGKR